MNRSDREPDLPEPLAAHLATSAEARVTWDALSLEDRHALASWVHQAWFARGERERAEELFEAMRGGIDAFSVWTRAQQWLPASSSGLFGLP